MVNHGLSQLILAQADKVMLKNMMNNSVVGIYSFTFTFAHVMNIIYNAFNNTWVPFYYDDVKAENYEAIHRRSKNYIYVFTALSIGFILLAPDVIKLFAGKDFWTGISLIPVFVLANYMMFLYSFPVNVHSYSNRYKCSSCDKLHTKLHINSQNGNGGSSSCNVDFLCYAVDFSSFSVKVFYWRTLSLYN